MNVPFTGGCACGAIRYNCSSPPRYMGNCHCRDCQQATGSAFFPAVVVEEGDFTLLGGEPSWFESPSDKGHPMHRAFCPGCGSPVFLINGANATVRALYAGSLDDPSWYRPSRDIYSRERTAVDCDGPRVAQGRGHAREIAESRARQRPFGTRAPHINEHQPTESEFRPEWARPFP